MTFRRAIAVVAAAAALLLALATAASAGTRKKGDVYYDMHKRPAPTVYYDM